MRVIFLFKNMFNRHSGVCWSNTDAANYELPKGKADCKAVQPDQEVVIQYWRLVGFKAFGNGTLPAVSQHTFVLQNQHVLKVESNFSATLGFSQREHVIPKQDVRTSCEGPGWKAKL